MNHSLNITHDGTLIVRVPKGYKVEKVKVETFEGEEILTHTTPSNTLDALDCISRQDAIDNLERYRELFSWDDGDRERAILSRVIKELQSMPSVQSDKDLIHLQKEQSYMQGYADGQKPRKGKWIIQGNRGVCSECHKYMIFGYDFNFCPNCGADMRGDLYEGSD